VYRVSGHAPTVPHSADEDDQDGRIRFLQIQGPGPPSWGLGARLKTSLCKNGTVAKSKDVKIGCNLTERSEEGCESKRVVLSVMTTMMVIIMMMQNKLK
jgi:hypothetical protein